VAVDSLFYYPDYFPNRKISNSSFYSKSSSFERIAESTNLRAPTTAVGALVASSRGVSFATEQHKPSLPPRHDDWILDDNNTPHHHHQVHRHVHDQRLEDEFDAAMARIIGIVRP